MPAGVVPSRSVLDIEGIDEDEEDEEERER